MAAVVRSGSTKTAENRLAKLRQIPPRAKLFGESRVGGDFGGVGDVKFDTLSNRILNYAGLASLAWLSLVSTAQATCNATGISWGGIFCNGCRYESGMSVSRDEPCERTLGSSGSIGLAPEFLGSHIVQRAKHGVAGVNGTTFAYAPAKGYTGNG